MCNKYSHTHTPINNRLEELGIARRSILPSCFFLILKSPIETAIHLDMLDFSFEKFPISTSVWPDPCQPIPFAPSYCISLDSPNALPRIFPIRHFESDALRRLDRTFTISMHRAGLKSQFYGVAARTSTEKRHIKSENSHRFDLPQTRCAELYWFEAVAAAAAHQK